MTNSSSISATRCTALTGVVLVFTAAIAFSAKAVIVKLAYRYPVDAVTLLALRMAFALPFFLLIAWWSRRGGQGEPLGGREWLAIVGLGMLGFYLASFLDFLGLEYIGAGLERLILFLYPTLVVLITALLARRAVRRREAAALALSYAGIALALFHEIRLDPSHFAMGAALVFGSALAFALYLVGSGALIQRVGAVKFTAFAMTAASIACIAQFLLTHAVDRLRLPAPVYALSLTMALLSTVLPVFLLSAGIRCIGAGRAALIGSVGPVSTLFLAAVFLHEAVSPLQAAGTVLVLGGVLMITVRR
ncbi:MAG TPA: EamA family transporter [Betaproteobacteria bacterium]|nr:EamA family transporter [Betaproteobacteria bacterium]